MESDIGVISSKMLTSHKIFIPKCVYTQYEICSGDVTLLPGYSVIFTIVLSVLLQESYQKRGFSIRQLSPV
jgi:hypothetical protein